MLSQSHRGLPSARPNWYFPKSKDQPFDFSILVSTGNYLGGPLRHPKLAEPLGSKHAVAVRRRLLKVGRLPGPAAIHLGDQRKARSPAVGFRRSRNNSYRNQHV